MLLQNYQNHPHQLNILILPFFILSPNIIPMMILINFLIIITLPIILSNFLLLTTLAITILISKFTF